MSRLTDEELRKAYHGVLANHVESLRAVADAAVAAYKANHLPDTERAARADHADWCVQIPRNEDEAALMSLVGYKWLRDNAPHRLAARAEPVAWYHPSGDGYDSNFRDHSTVVESKGNPWDGWIPLYTHPNHTEDKLEMVVPEGYVLVPVEPTKEMQLAGAEAIRFDTTAINKLWTGNKVFQAMLAAAPTNKEIK